MSNDLRHALSEDAAVDRFWSFEIRVYNLRSVLAG